MRHSNSRLLAALTLLLIGSPAFGQPASLWSKTYGRDLNDQFFNAATTADGGVAMVGLSFFLDTTRREDVSLIVTDSEGDSLWSRSYGTDQFDYGSAVCITRDGNIVVASYVSARGGTCWLTCFSPDGDSLWSRSLGEEYVGTWCWNLIALEDGGLALSGYTARNDGITSNFWLAKTDSVGNLLWTRSYGDRLNMYCWGCTETADGGFAMMGTGRLFESPEGNLLVIRTDADGNELWSRYYFTTYWAGGSIVQTDDGGFAVAGTALQRNGWSDAYLTQLDSSGEVTWTQYYDHYVGDLCAKAVKSPYGGFLLVGSVQSEGNSERDGLMIRVDRDGNILWTDIIGAAESPQSFSTVLPADDGCYILAGANTVGNGFGSDFWLYKTDSDPASVNDRPVTPYSLGLSSFPSPFNSSTFVSYSTPFTGPLSATLVTIGGRELTKWTGLQAGKGRIMIDGAGLATGEYWLRLEQNGNTATTRLVLVR